MKRSAPRFVVRSLHGGAIRPPARTSPRRHGLTVWVADEALYGREVQVWRSEQQRGPFKQAWLFAQARHLADRLNRSES